VDFDSFEASKLQMVQPEEVLLPQVVDVVEQDVALEPRGHVGAELGELLVVAPEHGVGHEGGDPLLLGAQLPVVRRETEEAARQTHALIESGKTPKPVYEKRCDSCSLLNECLPKSIQKKRSVKQYLSRLTEEL